MLERLVVAFFGAVLGVFGAWLVEFGSLGQTIGGAIGAVGLLAPYWYFAPASRPLRRVTWTEDIRPSLDTTRPKSTPAYRPSRGRWKR